MTLYIAPASTTTEPPVFTVKPEDLKIKEAAKARLHCAAQGIPTPTLTWLYNGRVVGDRTERQDNNDLVIWNLREKDQGFYQCVASSESGEVQASALLTVELPGNMLPKVQSVIMCEFCAVQVCDL